MHVRGGEENVSKPIKKEDSSDHLIRVGTGPSSPHLFPIQDIKHTLLRKNQTLKLSITLNTLWDGQGFYGGLERKYNGEGT